MERQADTESDTSVVDMAFTDAMALLDNANITGDRTFLREQWLRVQPGSNLDGSVASSNRVVITAKLAEFVQRWVPEKEAEAFAYLLTLSRSNNPSHREAAAFAMRQSKGREAVSALFSAAIDSDERVSRFALQSLRWKLEFPVSDERGKGASDDSSLIKRNLAALCSDPRLPKANVDECALIAEPHR